MQTRSTWAAVAFAVIVVIAVAVVIAVTWNQLGNSEISPAGWLALAFGVAMTLALGIGLMRLMFISSRQGYDDRGKHG